MEYLIYILVGKGEGESFKLEPDIEYTIGRHSKNNIRMLDENISRKHIKIKVKDDKYFITDLGSKNGTFVDGKNLAPGIETEVKEGVPIVIGMTIIGLGPMCELLLKPSLDSAGFYKLVSKNGEAYKPKRVISIKKNLEFIYNVNNFLVELKDINKIFKEFVINVFNLLKRIDRCVVISINYETGKIDNILYQSKNPLYDPEKLFNRELVKKALILNKTVMVKDSNIIQDEDNRITKSLQIMKIRSAMCVPISSCEKLRGVIYVDSLEKPYGFRESDAVLLRDVCSRVALAIDNLATQTS
jgi:pSer/pThr/pTyr-binding forkhead associated (FHA) protein